MVFVLDNAIAPGEQEYVSDMVSARGRFRSPLVVASCPKSSTSISWFLCVFAALVVRRFPLGFDYLGLVFVVLGNSTRINIGVAFFGACLLLLLNSSPLSSS